MLSRKAIVLGCLLAVAAGCVAGPADGTEEAPADGSGGSPEPIETTTRAAQSVMFPSPHRTPVAEEVGPAQLGELRSLGNSNRAVEAAWVEVEAVDTGRYTAVSPPQVVSFYSLVQLRVLDDLTASNAEWFVVAAFAPELSNHLGWHSGWAQVGQRGIMVIESLERWPSAEREYVRDVRVRTGELTSARDGIVRLWYAETGGRVLEATLTGGRLEAAVVEGLIAEYLP